MPLENPFYTAEMQGPFVTVPLGRFELEEGGVIPELELAVATYGELNEAKDNVILIPTWFSGTHATWWQVYIGPGRALDPEKYFIVVVNQIGNGLSTSPHTTDDESIAAERFPKVRIGDDVRAQEQLLRETYGVRAARPGGGRVDGGPADVGVGRPLPRQGAAGRPDRGHGAEHAARLPLHPDADGRHHLGPGLERRPLRQPHRRRRRPAAPRRHLGRHGTDHGLLEVRVLEGPAAGRRGARVERPSRSSSRTSPACSSGSWTRTPCWPWAGSGSAATSPATPTATWPPRSDG